MAHGDHGNHDHGITRLLTRLVRARVALRLRRLLPELELVRLAGRVLEGHHLDAEPDPCATLRRFLQTTWQLDQGDAHVLALELYCFRHLTARDAIATSTLYTFT